MSGKNLVEVRNLKKYFKTQGGMLHAVDDVTFTIGMGKTMGVVGESGCGKSTLGRTIIHLLESNGGTIFFDGKDITSLKNRELRKFREIAGIIFQDPYSSLDPRFTVERIIQEPLRISGHYSQAELRDRTDELMEMVGIDQRLALSYPHELDGGRRQRIGIARAMALNPRFIVCDEPVSALDVSIQAQVLNLLQDLQEERGLTYMFVTHNMSVVRHISNEICVMYLGQLVETGPTDEIFDKPFHPYTKALLSAIPSVDITKTETHIQLKGELTSPINPKPSCRFSKRWMYAKDECSRAQSLEEAETGHFVSCCRVKEVNGL
jgi:peptide/nickel transport system ATP-binding protein